MSTADIIRVVRYPPNLRATYSGGMALKMYATGRSQPLVIKMGQIANTCEIMEKLLELSDKHLATHTDGFDGIELEMHIFYFLPDRMTVINDLLLSGEMPSASNV